MINLGSEVGCVISEGPWIFVGITNMVKVRQEEKSICSLCCIYVSEQ